MMEDELLLNRLGIVSANPVDIEKDVLSKAETKAKQHGGFQDEEKATEQSPLQKGQEDQDDVSPEKRQIYAQLRALEIEIDAVSEGLDVVKAAANKDSEEVSEGDEVELGKSLKDKLLLVEGGELQQALATERLRSLKQKKEELEKQLYDIKEDKGPKYPKLKKLLSYLVASDTGQKSKASVKSPDKSKKRKRNQSVLEDDDGFDAALDAASSGFIETERDEMIRRGLLTPFDQVKGFERRVQRTHPSRDSHPVVDDRNISSASSLVKARPSTKLLDAAELPRLEAPTSEFHRVRRTSIPVEPKESKKSLKNVSKASKKKTRRPLAGEHWRKAVSRDDVQVDDYDQNNNVSMEEKTTDDRQKAKKNRSDSTFSDSDSDYNMEIDNEVSDDSNSEEDIINLEGGLKIPGRIFDKLFDYQKTGVKWLWELHCQRAGGIIGDEMGLGKTIQVISFLAALHFSGMYKPSIILCPVTLLRQWRREVQKWYPRLRVSIVHDSISIPAVKKNKAKENEDDSEETSDEEKVTHGKDKNRWDKLINSVAESDSGLLITTYEQLRILRDKLLTVEWGYAVLDEGHRIRNPNAEITLVCKQLHTVHRIIMTGAPIQNKLTELWSLFDFVFPGKLGVLPVFEAQFGAPIAIGGYANATPLSVSTAYKCAVVLRDLIMPYMLRRMKSDVNAQLTKKTEQVLFCSLSQEQRRAYRAFLASSDVEQIFEGSRNSLYGIDILRKICNHPDLLERETSSKHQDYGNPERSGKMKVVAQVLKVWKEQGHRVLVFTQTQQMLDILENYLVCEGLTYRRMDGLTPPRQRTALMDEFNQCTDVFVFILTTRVGGLGTNLIGANRVIIFDPDWNPSTDMQARERAWRIGQTRDVTVYRLITRGTIEEKIYHRQIYKHFLTNKILKNPRQRRFFKAKDMRDLFTLQDELGKDKTETSNIFSEIAVEDDSGDKQNIVSSSSGSVSKAYESKGKGKIEGVETPSKSDESDMLKCLLANSIHSAIDHDAIMHIDDEEKTKMEDEASQVAQRAATALRESRMLRSQDSIAVPTWTGRSGAAGAPATIRRRFGSTLNPHLESSTNSGVRNGLNGLNTTVGPCLAGASSGKALSSGDLLARIRRNRDDAVDAGLEFQRLSERACTIRTNSTNTPGSSHMASPHRPPVSLQPEILIRQLYTFMEKRGGRVGSSAIVEHFKDSVPPKDLSLFKKLLKEIAVLGKEGGQGVWVLKPDYRIDIPMLDDHKISLF